MSAVCACLKSWDHFSSQIKHKPPNLKLLSNCEIQPHVYNRANEDRAQTRLYVFIRNRHKIKISQRQVGSGTGAGNMSICRSRKTNMDAAGVRYFKAVWGPAVPEPKYVISLALVAPHRRRHKYFISISKYIYIDTHTYETYIIYTTLWGRRAPSGPYMISV